MKTYQCKDGDLSLSYSLLNLFYSTGFCAPQKKKQYLLINDVSKFENKEIACATKDNLSQKEFLTAIIHELKTPLNAIVGFSEALQEDIHNPKSVEECADYAKEITKAAMDLNGLIHDLLDVGMGSDSGSFSVDLDKEIDVRDVVQRSIRLNKDYAMGRGIVINTEITENVSMIKLDVKRMKQVLSNLISNAIKYSFEKTEIKIKANNIVEDDVTYLQIAVSDQGFGMTKSQIKTAFQKYKTIPNPNSGKVDSFGLGLPIVKQLVELQNGSIEVESEPSKGTTITLRFPYLM